MVLFKIEFLGNVPRDVVEVYPGRQAMTFGLEWSSSSLGRMLGRALGFVTRDLDRRGLLIAY
jgi:hypothetical protein